MCVCVYLCCVEGLTKESSTLAHGALGLVGWKLGQVTACWFVPSVPVWPTFIHLFSPAKLDHPETARRHWSPSDARDLADGLGFPLGFEMRWPLWKISQFKIEDFSAGQSDVCIAYIVYSSLCPLCPLGSLECSFQRNFSKHTHIVDRKYRLIWNTVET